MARVGGELTRLCPRLGTRVADNASADRIGRRHGTVPYIRCRRRSPAADRRTDGRWSSFSMICSGRSRLPSFSSVIWFGHWPTPRFWSCVSRRDPGEQMVRASCGRRIRRPRAGRGPPLSADRPGRGRVGRTGRCRRLMRCLIPSCAGSPGRLREETAGNPLYASQLVRHWMELGRAAGAPCGVDRAARRWCCPRAFRRASARSSGAG